MRAARERLVSTFDWNTTMPEHALGISVRHGAAWSKRDALGEMTAWKK
jgi:hypothetical protein